MKLADFQNKIFSFLSSETSESPRLMFVRESKGISRDERLNSYKESFKGRTISSIKKDFQVTGKFLGTKNFKEYLQKYLSAHPSKTHYINEISRDLPAYIEKNLPDGAAPFTVELAYLEWTMIECFYNYFSFADVRTDSTKPALNGETLIQCNRSLMLFESDWPLDKIWKEEKAQDKRRSHLAIWTREDRKVRIRSFSSLEYKVLGIMKKSQSLEQAIDLSSSLGETKDLIYIFRDKFPLWVRTGIVSLLAPQSKNTHPHANP